MHDFLLPRSRSMLVQYSWAKYQFSTVHLLHFVLRVIPVAPRACTASIFVQHHLGEKGTLVTTAFSSILSLKAGMQGLGVAQVFLFFSFVHEDTYYPCALVQWFSIIGDEPDDETGFWMVKADICDNGQPSLAIIHLDSIYRAAHLVPAYCSSDFVNRLLTMHDALDNFKTFYVNKYVDYHAFEIAS